ncbi:DNA recombination protein RmuC [Frigoribacterium sp. PvP032]|uniref:DNA recombination protein RmuC n=1 Tax=Frigoribacterium sp. PvP032 TaxID=2806589 RepID=UPI001AE98700|nr:DNA recombination protein RmuC [Frigoribacterium sp. PvP032]MBP1191470.1 DNA recombination protein RmuC [Frigoribacterium sp. PvP032]
MTSPLLLVALVVVALGVGTALGVLLSRSRAAEATARLSADAAAARATVDGYRERLIDLDEQHRREVAGQEARLREFQDRLRDARIAEAERARSEGQVMTALSPVAQSLAAVQAKVAELEEQRAHQYGTLSEQLRSAVASEERLRSTAESLASALRSNSTRGVWGETQLRNVVQAAGLVERVDFDLQSSISSDAGAGRPDMVVHLPGGKNIAVDAKVPFAAFLEASAIPATAVGEEAARRDVLVRQHVKALRAHVDALSAKTYWAGLESSPELVVAFIPSESLVSSALEADPSLMDYAFQKRVALASPVTLWSVLKTVAFSWQQDVVTNEAKVLFDLSRELYGRLATMAGHVDKLGRSLRGSVNDYNRFVGSLERTVLPSARRLSMLDETKSLTSPTVVEELPRDLTATELTTALDADREVEASRAAADEREPSQATWTERAS